MANVKPIILDSEGNFSQMTTGDVIDPALLGALGAANIVSVNTSTQGGGVLGSPVTFSNGTIGLIAGSNITLSQNSNSIVIIGASGQASSYVQGNNTVGVSNLGNTQGNTSPVTGPSVAFVLAGGNNITLSQSVSGSSATVTVIGPTQSAQPGIQSIAVEGLTFTTGQVAFSNANGISFGNLGGQITASYTVPTQSVQTVGIYANGNTTGQSSNSTVDARSLSFQGAGVASVGMSGGVVVVSVPSGGGGTGGVAQTVQTQNLHNLTLAGNSTSAGAGYLQVSSGTLTLAGGNNITLSQNGNAVTISGPNVPVQSVQPGIQSIAVGGSTFTTGQVAFSDANGISFGNSGGQITASYTVPTTVVQTNQTVGLYVAGNTTGQSSSSTVDARSVSYSGAGIVSVGMSGGNFVISATTAAQTIQTQNLHNISLSGNTAGVMAQVSSGTLTLAGGNNITLSQNGNAVTISGPNTIAQTVQPAIQSIAVGGSTFTTGQVAFSNTNGISFGNSGGQITASYTVPTQTVQPAIQSVAVGGSTFTTGQVAFSNANGISFGNSGGQITASYTVPTQTVQPGIQSVVVSNTTYTTGAVSFSNANGISFGSSAGGAITASYTVPTTVAQTNQTVGLYAIGNTTQSSSGTIDARSLSFQGAGVASVGVTGGTVVISMGAGAQTVQTQNMVDVTLAGNSTSAGAGFALASSGTLTLAGGNNITLSQNGNAITISGVNTVAQSVQPAIQSIAVGGSTFTTGQVAFSNTNGISFGNSGGQITASYTVPTTVAQTNQTVGMYYVGNTTGQSSSSTVDARSLSFQGAGVASIGMSGGSVIVSVPAGGGGGDGVNVLAVNAGGTALSTTYTLSNANNISFGVAAGVITATASYVAQTVQTQNVYQAVISGNTAGVAATISSGTLTLAGGNNITLSQVGNAVTISGVNTVAQSVQPGIQSIAVGGSTFTTGQVAFSNTNGISFGNSGGQITASYTVPTQSVQPGIQSIIVSNTTYTTGAVSFSNANGISFGSSAGGAITASYTLPTQSVQPGIQSIAVGGSTFTTGQVAFSNANGISFGNSGGQITASYTVPTTVAQTVQTQNVYQAVISGNTAGVAATISSGTLTLAGGNNITLSQVGNAVTISGVNTVAQTVQPAIQSIAVGGSTFTTGQVAFSNANGISFGNSGGQITASYTVPTTVAQTNQTVGFYAAGNTTGQSSSSTIDARSLSFQGAGVASVGMSGGSVIVSVPAGGGGGDGVNVIAVNAGATALSTTLTLSNANNVSFGVAAGVITATASYVAQTVQTQNLHNVTLSGNTAGVMAQVSSGTLTLAGGNNITLSQVGNAITISGVNTVAQTVQPGIQSIAVGGSTFTTGQVAFSNTNGISFGNSGGQITASYTVPTQTVQPGIQSIVVSNTTYTTGAVSFSNVNGISFGSSAGGAITASYTVPTQSVQPGIQSIAVGGSTFTTGQVAFSDANGISFGNSGGQITASYTVPTTVAQTNQSLGLYYVGNTTGQSSSSTVDARSLSFQGAGIASVGMSGGSVIVSVPAGGGGGDGYNIVSMLTSTSGGGTAGATYSALSGSIGLMAGSGVTLSQTSNTIVFNINTAPDTFFIAGNTAGAQSSVTGDAFYLSGGNNITLSYNAGTIAISAGAGGGGAGVTLQNYEPVTWLSTVGLSMAQNTLYVNSLPLVGNISANYMMFPVVMTAGWTTQTLATNSTATTGVSSSFSAGQTFTFALFTDGTGVNSTNLYTFYTTTLTMSTQISYSVTNSNTSTGTQSVGSTMGYTYGLPTLVSGTQTSVNAASTVTTWQVTTSIFTNSSTFSTNGTSTSGWPGGTTNATWAGSRLMWVPMNTSFSAGQYWIGYLRSSTTTNAAVAGTFSGVAQTFTTYDSSSRWAPMGMATSQASFLSHPSGTVNGMYTASYAMSSNYAGAFGSAGALPKSLIVGSSTTNTSGSVSRFYNRFMGELW